MPQESTPAEAAPPTPSSRTIAPPNVPISPTASELLYRTYEGHEIDDAMLDRCAKLFSENYGIWGTTPGTTKGPKPGSRVKMTGGRLRQQCVGAPEKTVLVVCYQRNFRSDNMAQAELVGHAFATAWDFQYDSRSGRVAWVTQLVVRLDARKRYIATSMLQMLKAHRTFRDITALGLVSSHPAACHALSKYTDIAIGSIDLDFCKIHAKSILSASPVDYVRDMALRGSLFEENCTTGAVSSMLTNFYVDHGEPLAALAAYQARNAWALGELLDGHEFLIILPNSGNINPSDASLGVFQ
ncbi:hypothetical protein FPV67DRAFT_1495049 [Lyophyllum atratum]|nr:hypothetical protein FPV67DRAFT_1495049 [Lyophyllum atratum]